MDSDTLQETLDCVALSASGDEVPREIVLFRKGTKHTMKGEFVFDEAAASSVLAAFGEHGADKLPFDASHLMLTSDNPEAKKALGWFVPSVNAAGDLLASQIEWTPKTEEALRNREFRFVSPAIQFDAKTRRISRLVNVALTNLLAKKSSTAHVEW